MNRIDDLKKYFLSLPEVIRIKELEGYIDNNPEIKNAFSNLKEIQKQMVNAKEYNQINQYKVFKEEYEKQKEDLINLPFVEEYLELIDIVNNMLEDLAYLVDKEIDINKKQG